MIALTYSGFFSVIMTVNIIVAKYISANIIIRTFRLGKLINYFFYTTN